jgi:hypothetical protein
LFQKRWLALASLLFVSCFAAHAAPVQMIDAGPEAPSGVSTLDLVALDLGGASPDLSNLPDDPSAVVLGEFQDQQTQPGQPTSTGDSSSQPAQNPAGSAPLSS